MVYVFASTEAQRAEIRENLSGMARRYYESLTIVIADPLDFPDLPARLGLEPGVFPAGAVHQLSVNRIYPYPRDRPITSKALQKWGVGRSFTGFFYLSWAVSGGCISHISALVPRYG
jgi:protein disulfide-isomerase A1